MSLVWQSVFPQEVSDLKEFLEKHGLRVLFAAAVLSAAISLLSFLGSTTNVLQNAFGVLTSPVRALCTGVEDWFADKRQYYADTTALKEENEALRRRVAELEQQLRQSQTDAEENALLRELLGLREQRRDLTLESAKVTAHESTNWVSSMTLDRGTADGVAIGNCVLSSAGYLVGVVSEAGYNWCTVLTTLDTSSEIGAKVFRTGELCVAAGDFSLMQENRLKLEYLADAPLLAGDCVLTSGLGDFYPAGLVIGTVERVETDADGLTRYAVVVPMEEPDTLHTVFIVKSFEIEE